MESILRNNFNENGLLKDRLYLLDQNIKNNNGTRPKKYFINLEDVLFKYTNDDEIRDFSIKNNLTVVTNDSLFVIDLLLNNCDVVYQNNNSTRYYLKIKNLFQFDNIDYNPESQSLPLKNKITIINKIKNIFKKSLKQDVKKLYLNDFKTSNMQYNRKREYFIHSSNIFLKELSNHNSSQRSKYIISYAVQNNLTIVTKSKKLCIQALIRCKRCIFEDEYEIRHYIILDSSFEFEKISIDKKTNPNQKNIINSNDLLEKDILENNVLKIINNLDESYRQLIYIQNQLKLRKKIEVKLCGSELQLLTQRHLDESCYN